MPKCDLIKLAWVFSCKLLDIFRRPFPKNTSGGLLLSTRDSPPVKWDLISAIIDFAYELSHDLRLDLTKFRDIRKISKVGWDMA